MSPDAHLSLAEGHHHDVTEWEQAAAAVLRKAGRLAEGDSDDAVWDRLTQRTLDGIAITPLGTPALVADLPAPVRPPARGDGWDVRALLADPDPTGANASALSDLQNGVTSLLVQVGASGIAATDLAETLKGVLLDVAPVVLDAPSDPLAAARAFAAVAQGTTLAPGTNLGVDPVAARLRLPVVEGGGQDRLETAEIAETVVEAATLAGELGCRALVVDGTAVHDLGASDVQELGYVLAVAAHYLRALGEAGHDIDAAQALVEFRLAASDEHRGMRLHAVTSRPMMTKYDPWVNMLRTCVAAFAAGVGGADAVTVLPFDARLGLPDAFARRIARNTSALLVEESHVAKVADPAGGAFAVERLTDDLAVAGWEELGRLEESGGVVAALEDGSLRSRIDEVVTRREQQIARRKRPITGLTEFPNLHETLPERKPYADGAIAVRPYGHAFEALREQPAGDKVFLATLGTIAAHTARATFATNLFAAGGIDVVNAGRHDDVEAVVRDYAGPDGGQSVVCLVGHDKAYASWGVNVVAALREAGATHVILAGKPVEGVDVDDTCAVGVDALDFLTRTREKLA